MTTVLAVIGLALGLVVALLVVGLFNRVVRPALEIERSVMEVWTMGKRVAQNTQTTHLLVTTKARGVDLLEELGQHPPPQERSGP